MVNNLIEKYTKPHTVEWWGRTCLVKPALASFTIGRGDAVIIFQCDAHRPDYYVIRADSRIKEDPFYLPEELKREVAEHFFSPEVKYSKVDDDIWEQMFTEYLLDKLIEEFGDCSDCDDDDSEAPDCAGFPCISTNDGYGWELVTEYENG